MSDDLDRAQIHTDFHDAVNMAPQELADWLETDESKDVGWTKEGEDEAVGHKSGKRIVEIKRTKKADLTDEDYEHMRKVVGYVHRHSAQSGPKEDKQHSPWRYSLMNWGHDHCKGGPLDQLRLRPVRTRRVSRPQWPDKRLNIVSGVALAPRRVPLGL